MKWKLATTAMIVMTLITKASPVASDDSHEQVLNKETFFHNDRVIYRSNYTIHNLLLVVRNHVSSSENEEINILFNQVNEQPDGARVELGQYILTRKEGNDSIVRKIFDGKCSALDFSTGEVYFGAADGLYVWDQYEDAAKRLGDVKDNIVDIAVANGTAQIYYLTEPEHRIYQVDLMGENKRLVEKIPSARAFTLDRQNNIYFYGDDRVMRVLKTDAESCVTFPSLTTEKKILLTRPFIDSETGAPALVDERLYILFSNGTARRMNTMRMGEAVTSMSIESPLLLYFAIDGSMYEINLILLMVNRLFGSAFANAV